MSVLNKTLMLAAVFVVPLSLANCASSSGGTGGSGGSGASGGNGGSSGTAGSGGASGSSGASGTAGAGTGGSAGAGTGGSAGAGTGGSAGAGTGGSGAGGSAGAGAAGAAGASCKAPGSLHTNTIYCPFSATAGGKNVYCTPGSQHCCEGVTSTDVSTCEALATPCTSGWTDWVCQKDADCGSGKQCCAAGTLVQNPDTSCANYASKFHATQCETSCAAGEIHMCVANGECAGGKTCMPFDTKGAQVGGCYPQ